MRRQPDYYHYYELYLPDKKQRLTTLSRACYAQLYREENSFRDWLSLNKKILVQKVQTDVSERFFRHYIKQICSLMGIKGKLIRINKPYVIEAASKYDKGVVMGPHHYEMRINFSNAKYTMIPRFTLDTIRWVWEGNGSMLFPHETQQTLLMFHNEAFLEALYAAIKENMKLYKNYYSGMHGGHKEMLAFADRLGIKKMIELVKDYNGPNGYLMEFLRESK